MNEVKDSVANVATIGSLGMSMMQVESLLTIGLLITALWLNIQRIMANRRKSQEDKPE
jgi:hypothetical protein